MIDTSQLTIQNLVIHHIGNRTQGEPVRYSKKTVELEEENPVNDFLVQYFFKPFKTEAYYNFTDGENGEPNIMFELAGRVFNGTDSFYDVSLEVARLLHESSNHPGIKAGEFYMAHFKDVVVDGELVDAIGIFKSENKETFLKVYLKEQNFEIGAQEGINIRKLDKGCLIFNTEKDAGYKICSVDNINKGNDAKFWMNDFLGLKPREDNYYFTNNYLELCKNFV
ncbi:MAG: nucleoid-associated protein, partial [Chlorobi bacterium]|nr:nucleoid-associated protein [Chlorobiota bacterium]